MKEIVLPLSLKKSQLEQIYRDNVLSKEPALTYSVSNSEIKINNQDDVRETGSASSPQRTENEVWTDDVI